MKKDNCIFCKIASGEIPAKTIYEDDKFKAFFDLGPATKGHALIIPKEHYDNLYELEDTIAGALLVKAKQIATAMKDAFEADGLNLVQNNGTVAGQSVFHFHMHMIPRYEGDQAMKLWTPGETDAEKLEELKEQVVKKLQGV